METSTSDVLTLEDVWRRVPLLRRVVRDVVSHQVTRKNSKEFLDELNVISKKFTSVEIVETMNRLRRDVTACDRALEAFAKEIRDLGGVLKDATKGLVYFHSERDNRRIFLIWELGEPELVSWHELDEEFSDRLPAEFPEGSEPTLLDSPKD